APCEVKASMLTIETASKALLTRQSTLPRACAITSNEKHRKSSGERKRPRPSRNGSAHGTGRPGPGPSASSALPAFGPNLNHSCTNDLAPEELTVLDTLVLHEASAHGYLFKGRNGDGQSASVAFPTVLSVRLPIHGNLLPGCELHNFCVSRP